MENPIYWVYGALERTTDMIQNTALMGTRVINTVSPGALSLIAQLDYHRISQWRNKHLCSS